MRLLPLALVAVLVLVPAAVQAQPPTFTQPYQVRAGVGDLPLTPAVEPSGRWNVEQRFTFDVAADASQDARSIQFFLPAGAALVNVTCDCTVSHQANAFGLLATVDASSGAGRFTITVLTAQTFGSVVGFSAFAPFEAGPEQAVILYVPTDSDLTGAVDLDTLACTSGVPCTIHYATFDADHPRPLDLWFAIHPDNAVSAGVADEDGWDDNTWLFLGLGLLVGALLWAFLVSKGMVQTKGRKQVATTAAHVEAAANDPPAVLEGKKRALMAALKEVELAKQANEMPVEVYDAVKADLKKQTVTVMRALDTAKATDKPG